MSILEKQTPVESFCNRFTYFPLGNYKWPSALDMFLGVQVLI